jgi:NCS1 family nucleobase:cation symporter-1
VGLVPATFKDVGDLTALVGFVLAGALYLLFFRLFHVKLGPPQTDEVSVVVGVDAADEVA